MHCSSRMAPNLPEDVVPRSHGTPGPQRATYGQASLPEDGLTLRGEPWLHFNGPL